MSVANTVQKLSGWLLAPEQPAAPAHVGPRAWGLTVDAWAALFCCVFLPVFVVLAVPAPLNQAREIDPALYTALALDYGEMTERFGATYYATRVSYIAPAALLYSAFGLETGYILLRIALLGMLATSVFMLTRSWFGLATAVVMSVIAVVGPWMLRALLWDYPDGAAVTYLFAAIALSLDRRGLASRALAAGAMFAFAINAQLFNIAIGGAFLLSWLIMLRLDVAQAVRRVLLTATGFVAAYAVMIVAVYQLYPVMGPFFEAVNFRTASSLLAGGAATWRLPLEQIITNGMYYSLAPFGTLLVLGGAIAISWRRGADDCWRRLRIAAALYLGIVCAGVAFMHFVLKTATLGVPWGVLYAFPPTLLAWAAILAPSLSRMSARGQWSVVALFGALTLGFFLLARLWLADFEKEWDEWDWLLAAGVLMVGVAALFRPARPFAAALLIAAVAHLPYRFEESFFHRMHSAELGAHENGVRAGGQHLLEVVTARAPLENGRTVIWHPTPSPLALRAVNSFLFWGYSLVDISGGDLPNLSVDDERDIRNAGFVVLISSSSRDIERGLLTLQGRGIVIDVLERADWSQDGFAYSFALVDIVDARETLAQAPSLREFALGNIVAHTDAASTAPDAQGLRIVTDPRQWAYSAALDLGSIPEEATTLIVELEVERGEFQVIIESNPVVRPPPQERGMPGAIRTLLLPIDPQTPQQLIIANASPAGPSIGVVQAVRLASDADAGGAP